MKGAITLILTILAIQMVMINLTTAVDGQHTCSLPPETGPCKAKVPRLYYDPISGECERFIYGGCRGNKNNFQTLEDCQKECGSAICNLPPEIGPFKCLAYFRRYFYNSTSGKCEFFVYGGCGGSQNNFETLAECKRTCEEGLGSWGTCRLPPETGPCRANVPRLYYNPLSGECERFTYGGCAGNANNFQTVEECEKECGEVVEGGYACSLPPKTGPCRAGFTRYYHNIETGECETFIYGGCQGNANNFRTKEECEKECDTCSLPPETGPCKAKFPRFYYNAISGECEHFIYGGCRGNRNNFQTMEECKNECATDICSLPPKSGLCLAYMPRFHYNVTSGECERFIYGGCGGNKNNFMTVEECQGECGEHGHGNFTSEA